MTKNDETGRHDEWARLRFSIVGGLLAAPPKRGELKAELELLSNKHWTHPVTKLPQRFSFSTIERWYYLTKKSSDPILAMRRKVRSDAGKQASLKPGLCAKIAEQHREHRSWSYQLHVDNLEVVVEKESELGPMRSYSTVRRYMLANGLRRIKSRRRGGVPGVDAADLRREQYETRSYEAEFVHSLWHFDFHVGSRRVLTQDGSWKAAKLLGFIDDHSRLCCHLQWYLDEETETLVHGVSQALQKRGLPRSMMGDQGPAMKGKEFQQGLEDLSISWDPTRPYSPEQNAKKEVFWSTVEGRLMAMLEGVEELTLNLLNEATQAWVEQDYNRKKHSEIGMPPIERFLSAKNVGRDCPGSEELRQAFRMHATRKQRHSDGTVSLDGRRYEVPSRYRNLDQVCLRYARWNMSVVDLFDRRTGKILCSLLPLDKTKNAEGIRRRRDVAAASSGDPSAQSTRGSGIAPLLQKCMEEYSATGLPPAYLPKHDLEDEVSQ
ncbi:MAG: transposase family protein [bacterium]|nr:transposase family protein [bacterium]